MKMKKWIPLLLVLTLVLTLFISCSGGDGYSGFPTEDSDYNSGDIGTVGGVVDDRKVIREYEITLETKNFNKTIADLRGEVEKVGGYEENARVNPATEKRQGNATIVFRIPTEQLETFNKSISGIGNVTSQMITSKDVSLSYADITARIESLRAEKARLMELYEKADTITESADLSERLASIGGELKSYENQLQIMEGRISMTSYTFHIDDVEEYTEDVNFFVKVWRAIGGSVSFFFEFLEIMIIGLIYMAPFVITLVLIIVAILAIILRKKIKARFVARREKRKQASAEVTAKVENATAESAEEAPAEEKAETETE